MRLSAFSDLETAGGVDAAGRFLWVAVLVASNPVFNVRPEHSQKRAPAVTWLSGDHGVKV